MVVAIIGAMGLLWLLLWESGVIIIAIAMAERSEIIAIAMIERSDNNNDNDGRAK